MALSVVGNMWLGRLLCLGGSDPAALEIPKAMQCASARAPSGDSPCPGSDVGRDGRRQSCTQLLCSRWVTTEMQDQTELRDTWVVGPGGSKWGSTVPMCARAAARWPSLMDLGSLGCKRLIPACTELFGSTLGRQRQLTAMMLKSHAASRHESGCFGKL